MISKSRKKTKRKSPEEIASRAKRLKYLRNTLRYTAKVIAKKCGVAESTYKSWETGLHTGLTAEAALRVVEVYKNEGIIGCTFDWLFQGIGIEPTLNQPSLVSSADTIGQEIQFFHQLHSNAVDYVVSDNSMEPFFSQGDYVIGIRSFNDNIEKLTGLFCIAQLQTGEVLIRKLAPGKVKKRYDLIPMNSDFPILKNVELFSAADIIWIRKPGVNL